MSSSKSNVMDKAVSKALKKLLAELKDKDVAVQERAAKKLKAYTATQSREMSKEDFTRFMNELINEHIFNLVNSNSTVEKIGGIMAIDELIDIEYDENSKTARLASYLNNALSCNDIDVMNRAAKSLGRLAQSSRGTLTAEFVEAEVKRALQTLKDDSPKNSSNRHSAVLVLRELAENAPTLFYVHVGSFFELVWSVLSDSTTQVRLDAVAALHAALVLIAERAERLRLQWYWKIYNDAQNGFKNGTPTQIHGSLITIGELLDNTGQQFINTRFKEVCDTILSYKDYKNDRNLVKRTVVMLLPRLAKFNPQEFVPAYLETCMTYLLGSLKKEKGEGDRAAVFLAIGQIALAVGKHITPYLDQIMVNIVASLEKPGSRLYCIEALSCISMLAKSVGPDLQPHMHIVSNKHQTDMTALLELMFGTGLSPMLTEALTELAGHIPSMLSNIQEKLMDHISLILAGKSFLHPDQRRFFLNATGSKEEGMNPYQEKPKAAIIQLALYTLGSFNLQEKLLIDFVRETVVGFLDDDDSGIRKAAAETCCSLLVRAHRSSAEAPTRGQLAVVTGEVLEKLLIVGIADPDPSVRKTVLSRLESTFDYHLAQAENLRSLFIALNDEVFEIRELAITTIGRLTIRNPAHVMPSLRKTLIQLLTELEFSGDSRNKEESARLLGHLIRSSRRLIKPYVEPILNVLLPKLEDPNPRVATCVLATLGELSIAGGKDIQPYIHQLLPLIIGTLQDKSSVVKREVALRTL
ncbi:Serine/threonine-protein kinase TOR, partial [Balamuthia mandrillaris]